MSSSIEAGENSSSLFYLENDSAQPIAVQLSLAKREMNEDGSEVNSKINNELSVYPSQLIIQPNEKRSVKVTWNDKQALATELAFRLIAEQLPVDIEKSKSKKASIKVLLKYIAALYISTDKFSADAQLSKFEVKNDKVIFTVDNKGTEHQVLNNLKMMINSSKTKKEITLEGQDLSGMIGENVLAQSHRNFSLPKTGKFSEISSNDKVKISFDKD
jgi:fimbrial chaperone protein